LLPVVVKTHRVRNDASLWNRLRSGRRPVLIAGPCVIESQELCFQVAAALKKACARLDFVFVFKASYDKANRTSAASFRGPGLERGLQVLGQIRDRLGGPVLTDVHDETQARLAAQCVDVLQIPAFLCRQTDLITSAVRTGKIVNIKKGQFLSPPEMGPVTAKAKAAGGEKLMLTERGTTFGYNNLVVDMRSIPIMAALGFPVIFDATHSVQLPGGASNQSGGQRQFAPFLARAAMAAGAHGIFMETHPEPERALSDGPNSIALSEMPAVLRELARVWKAVH
jgi:2-dehydro-3-deoxyphosphooctonate aldolase (KDO 8-P synthase)